MIFICSIHFYLSFFWFIHSFINIYFRFSFSLSNTTLSFFLTWFSYGYLFTEITVPVFMANEFQTYPLWDKWDQYQEIMLMLHYKSEDVENLSHWISTHFSESQVLFWRPKCSTFGHCCCRKHVLLWCLIGERAVQCFLIPRGF